MGNDIDIENNNIRKALEFIAPPYVSEASNDAIRLAIELAKELSESDQNLSHPIPEEYKALVIAYRAAHIIDGNSIESMKTTSFGQEYLRLTKAGQYDSEKINRVTSMLNQHR